MFALLLILVYHRTKNKNNCSVRNNTNPVGVTRPRGGTRKSRVGKNNTRAPPARSLSEHLAAPSRGQKGHHFVVVDGVGNELVRACDKVECEHRRRSYDLNV
ncbi:hypothetical protein T02_14247 [Trichinella nativa]|uniref:Uncharacterized protein n=1 Tax=Trichinella nativa TaxID=6335 RepID=A0A0V1L4J6_9BILA|nr:hypothetical protein T02_14247 [Trichinella nativa]